LIGEDDASSLAGRQGARQGEENHRITAEGTTTTHFEAGFVGFATHDGGINGGEELAHRMVLGHQEEVHGIAQAGNVPVKADAQAENNLTHRKIVDNAQIATQLLGIALTVGESVRYARRLS